MDNELKIVFERVIFMDEIDNKISILETQIDDLQKTKKYLNNSKKKQIDSVIEYMERNNLKKVDLFGFQFSIRKTTGKMICKNVEEITDEFSKYKKEANISKAKKFYKETEILPSGFDFEENTSLSVKRVNEEFQTTLLNFCENKDDEEDLDEL
jgi:hypothetical protein